MAVPLSIAASIAGLIVLTGEMAKISRQVLVSVKQEHQLLQDLHTDIDALQAVLHSIPLKFHGTEDDLEQEMLHKVLQPCRNIMQRLQKHLLFLQDVFSQGVMRRVALRSRISTTMKEVAEGRKQLESFKTALNIALHLQSLCVLSLYISINMLTKEINRAQTETVAMSMDICSLRTDITELTAQTSSSSRPASQCNFDALQYVDVDNVLLKKGSGNIKNAPSGQIDDSSSVEPQVVVNIQNVKTVDSFEAWLESLGPLEQATPLSSDTEASSTSGQDTPMEDSSLKHSRVRLRITGLSTPGADKGEGYEEIDLAMTDYFGSAIEALLEKGISIQYSIGTIENLLKLINNQVMLDYAAFASGINFWSRWPGWIPPFLSM
jgi:hypothetical protein